MGKNPGYRNWVCACLRTLSITEKYWSKKFHSCNFLKFIPFFQQIGDVCSFVVIVSDTSVCQIRVDFVDTQMLPPNLGECNQQYLTIKGNIWPLGVDRFCGNNIDGQHFYVEIDPSSNGYVTAYLSTRT